MNSEKASQSRFTPPNLLQRTPAIRLGFVPLNDCAPLIMAQELGLYRKYGLRVQLCREAGWATIRDKIIFGELEAAHALATLPIATTFGLGSVRCDCLTGLILSLNGNAITLSEALWNCGVRDARTLRNQAMERRGRKVLTLGVVSMYSSHNFLLRQWLASGGINPDQEVRIVAVPPPQMHINLKAGNLDGYCVGEPWNSVAVTNGTGWCAATSTQLASGHPEKVLLVQKTFAERRSEEHKGLIAALLDACEYCDVPSNREEMLQVLARPQYIHTPVEYLRKGFLPPFNFGHGQIEHLPNFTIFHGHDANVPSLQKASWVINHFLHSGVLKTPLDPEAARQTFRADIYEQACRLMGRGACEVGSLNTQTVMMMG